MHEVCLTLRDVALVARGSGALWWPGTRTLVVSDLHLGKSERVARRGGPLLPPYESRATLDRLAADVAALDPGRVIALGDSFDDDSAARGLDTGTIDRLTVLMAGRNWIWIAGNHDPAPLEIGGRCMGSVEDAGLIFRHVADQVRGAAEISGHYHPKIRITLGGRSVSRPAFLVDADRLILPAFGAYTGGLWADRAPLAELMGPDARAVLTGTPCIAVPLARCLRRAG